MTKRSKGFSLIELLIVMAMILIIAAIAIPSLIRSKMAANESSAASMVRTLYTSSVTYSSTYGNGFPVNLTQLGPPALGSTTGVTCASSGLVDPALASGTKSGYNFKVTGDGANAAPTGGCQGSTNFTAGATPILAGSTGQRSFCAGNDGVINADTTGTDDTSTTGMCAVFDPRYPRSSRHEAPPVRERPHFTFDGP